MSYQTVQPPVGGKVTIKNGKIHCPDNPVIPFIRGDGTGSDIWAASERVFNAAVEKAYGARRRISWFEVFAGETAKQKFDTWLPSIRAKLRVDGAAIGDSVAQFYYV